VIQVHVLIAGTNLQDFIQIIINRKTKRIFNILCTDEITNNYDGSDGIKKRDTSFINITN